MVSLTITKKIKKIKKTLSSRSAISRHLLITLVFMIGFIGMVNSASVFSLTNTARTFKTPTTDGEVFSMQGKQFDTPTTNIYLVFWMKIPSASFSSAGIGVIAALYEDDDSDIFECRLDNTGKMIKLFHPSASRTVINVN